MEKIKYNSPNHRVCNLMFAKNGRVFFQGKWRDLRGKTEKELSDGTKRMTLCLTGFESYSKNPDGDAVDVRTCSKRAYFYQHNSGTWSLENCREVPGSSSTEAVSFGTFLENKGFI